jgi:hypothetical protein
MVARMEDMPAGVIGLRASGKLTKDDYTDALEPALIAVVTDVDWVARAMKMFAWAMPGELAVYEDLGELEEAKAWAAG